MRESMGRRAGGSGRAEEAAMTTRRWFEFVSTRYRSSGSICPRPSFCVSPSPSPTRSLRRARYLDSPASFSVAPHRSRFFFVPRFVPDTRRADPLHHPPPLPLPVPRPLATAASVHLLYVPPAVSLALSLSLSIYLSAFLWRTRAPRINPSPFRAPYLLSRTGSLVLPLAPGGSSARALLSLFLPL